MSFLQVVGQLMQEIGPLIDRVMAIEWDEDSRWAIALSEETVLIVDYETEPERLVIWSEVTSIRDEGKVETLEGLLRFNALWQETGGTRMALNDQNGVLLIYDLPLHDLHVSALAAAVENLADSCEMWRNLLLAEENGMSGQGSDGASAHAIPV